MRSDVCLGTIVSLGRTANDMILAFRATFLGHWSTHKVLETLLSLSGGTKSLEVEGKVELTR